MDETKGSEGKKEEHKRRGPGFFRIVLGIFVLLLGIAWLADALGWNWNLSANLWRLWPVIIILFGVSVLSHGSRSGRWFGIGIAIILVAFLVVMSFSSWGSDRDVETTSVSIVREPAAMAATLDLDVGAIKLSVVGGSTQLVSGELRSSVAKLDQSVNFDGSQQHVTLATPAKDGFWWGRFGGKNELSLTVSNDVPLAFTLDGGAMDADLDFRTVPVSSVDINSGATDLNLRLGNKVGLTNVNIDAGASSIVVSVPTNVGVRLNLDTGVSSKSLENLRSLGDNTYESEGYESAASKINLDVNIGASSFTLDRE